VPVLRAFGPCDFEPGKSHPGKGRERVADAEFKLADARFKPADAKFKLADAKFKLADAEFKPADAEFKPADAKFKGGRGGGGGRFCGVFGKKLGGRLAPG